MFTGIIEETGIVQTYSRMINGAQLSIKCSKVLAQTNVGDSICVNGVCQTVEEIFSGGFKTKISDETLSVTTFDKLKQGDVVNLERALTLNSRLGGHIVSGHVDCTGKFIHSERLSEFYNLEFEIPSEFAKYLVYKGSVCVNGISLTVAKINDCVFETAIIPHTFENTNLQRLKIGDFVNIETDILSKYVEKFLLAKDNDNITKIDMKFLAENGYIQ